MPKSQNLSPLFLWVALGLATFFVYRPSLPGPFLFDDIGKIVQNPDLKSPRFLTRLVYPYDRPLWERNDPSRPVTYLTFALNYRFGKLDPYGYRVWNLILHFLNGILVFFLVRELLRHAPGAGSDLVAWITASLFLLHPVQTIGVAYIFNRSGELAALFLLSSIMLFSRAQRAYSWTLAASALCFITALFSKQDAVVLPILLLLTDYLLISQRRFSMLYKRKTFHAPFWGILAAYLFFRYVYFGGLGDLEAGPHPTDWSRWLYLSVQPYVVLQYWRRLLWPSGLCFDHALAKPAEWNSLALLIPDLLLFTLGIVAWGAYRQKSPRASLLVFSMAWFVLWILPTSSLFPTTAPMAENRLYLSSVGFFLVVALFCDRLLQVVGKQERRRTSFWILACVLAGSLICLMVAAARRSAVYRESTLLWEDVLAQYPTSTRALRNASSEHNNRGIALKDQGKDEQAVQEFSQALTIDPASAEAHYNLGLMYMRHPEQADLARQELEKTVMLNPSHAQAHNNLGILYMQQHQQAKALEQFKAAVKSDPSMAKSHNNLAYVFSLQRDYAAALQEFETGLRLDPTNESVKREIVQIRRALGQ